MLAVAAFIALGTGDAAAQGNLSTQGFGYPPGQLSTTALTLGGSSGELDAASALNPATAALWGATVLFMQYEPEIRTVKSPGYCSPLDDFTPCRPAGSSRTTTARFPMVGISVPLGRRLTAQVSASTFLDRTWRSVSVTEQNIGGTVVEATETFTSNGGITDFRLALAYNPSPRLQVGLAGHVFSGENRITIAQQFPDTVTFSGSVQTSDISYGALAGSAGLVLRPSSKLGLGASVRMGGDMETQVGDSVLSSAKMPMRYGVGVTFSGISGLSLSARANFDEWSAMEFLKREGSELRAFDSWDYGMGADIAGPTIGRRNIALRLGARHRGLPFSAGGGSGTRVFETAFSGGFGVPLGVGRSQLDVGVIRARRKAENENPAFAGGVTESAYIFSFGIRVRP